MWCVATIRRLRRELTVGELADRYIAEHLRLHNKPSTAVEFERLVTARIKPAFGSLRLGNLTRSDVKAWHTALRRSPYAANRALAVLRKMFSLAVYEWELVEGNPALGVKMYRETKRERFASDDDLARIGRWLNDAQRVGTVHPSFALAVNSSRSPACVFPRFSPLSGLRSISRTARSGSLTPRRGPELCRSEPRPEPS